MQTIRKSEILSVLAIVAFIVAFGTFGVANATLTIGATSLTTDGDYTVTSVAATAATMFAANTTGNITIGGSSQTSGVTAILGGTGTGVLGGSTSGIALTPGTAGTINIGAAAGTGAITLGSSTAAQTVNIANGVNAAAQVVNIGDGATAAAMDIDILTGAGTAGASTLNMADNVRVTAATLGNGANAAAMTIDIGSGTGGIGRTTTIGGGVPASGTDTLNLGTGNYVKAINIGTGTSANVIAIGTGQTGGSVTIGAAMTTGTITVGSVASGLLYYRDTAVLTGADAPAIGETGTTYMITTTGGVVTLPTASTANGVHFRWVVATAFDTDVVVTSAPTDIIEGSLIVAGAVVTCETGDSITFEDGAEDLGDYLELTSNGTNWFITGSNGQSASSLTCQS